MASLYCQLDMLERKNINCRIASLKLDYKRVSGGVSLVANSFWRVLFIVGSSIPYAGQLVFHKKDS